MGQGVAVLIIFPRETLDVVVASLDRALLWSLILVSQHVCLEILEHLSTIRISASSLLLGLLAAEVAILAAVGLMRG